MLSSNPDHHWWLLPHLQYSTCCMVYLWWQYPFQWKPSYEKLQPRRYYSGFTISRSPR